MSVRSWLIRWCWREIRDGDLLSVVFVLMLIVGSVFAIGSLVDRFDRYVVMQSQTMLTANLVLESPNPLMESFDEWVRSDALTFTDQLQFRTMAFSENSMELVKVKAVDESYPLLGALQLKINSEHYASSVSPGDLWLSERLMSLLNVKLGDVVSLGDADLRVSGSIIQDPEVSLNPFNQIPYAYIHHSSVPETGAVQLGGRLKYYRYFVGTESVIQDIKTSVSLLPGQRWVEDWALNREDSMVSRTRQYFGLTLMLVVVMAAITLSLTGHHYAYSRRVQVTTIKALGASRRWLLRWFVWQILLLFMFGCVGGVLLGLGLEQLLLSVLQSMLPGSLPTISSTPFLLACWVALVVILPSLGIPMLRLLDISAGASVTEHQRLPLKHRWWLLICPALGVLIAWAGDNRIIWYCLFGLVGILVVLSALGVATLRIKPLTKLRSSPLVLAVKRMRSMPAKVGVQLAGVTSALMLVSIIWLIQVDLLSDWQQTLPADAPNVFAVNIASNEKIPFVDALYGAQFVRSDYYPVVRGRLTKINNQVAQGDRPEKDRERALRRELNFTFRANLPDHNDLIAGEWVSANGVSVESGLADRLEIGIGDRLTFSVNSREFEVPITSIRYVPWRSMKPNFYFIFSEDILREFPVTWMLSFKVDEGLDQALNTLARSFPTVSLIDLRTLTQRALDLLRQLAKALILLASVSVVAGLVLVATMLRLSLNERIHEAYIYRMLGASRSHICKMLLGEFGFIGFLSGVLSVAGAELVMAALAYWVFDIPLTVHLWLWALVPLAAVTLVMAVVMIFLYQVMSSVEVRS